MIRDSQTVVTLSDYRPPKITVGEDFPRRVSKARHNVTPFMVKAIEDGKKAYLQYDKLVVNGKRFVYDNKRRELVVER